MKKLVLSAMLLLALAAVCVATPKLPKRPGYSASSTLLRAEPDYSGRWAMLVDGRRVGRLERQPGGLYLLRYPEGDAVRCSINEVVVMPEGK